MGKLTREGLFWEHIRKEGFAFRVLPEAEAIEFYRGMGQAIVKGIAENPSNETPVNIGALGIAVALMEGPE